MHEDIQATAELDEPISNFVDVKLSFTAEQPMFGDLMEVCGYQNPRFPPTGRFAFAQLEPLQFSQVDDYFGIRSLSEDGTDVVVWLSPLVDDVVVDHHSGPFDGLSLSFDALRNPARRGAEFLNVVETFIRHLPVQSSLTSRQVADRVAEIVCFWRKQGIEPGSDAALEIDE